MAPDAGDRVDTSWTTLLAVSGFVAITFAQVTNMILARNWACTLRDQEIEITTATVVASKRRAILAAINVRFIMFIVSFVNYETACSPSGTTKKGRNL